MPCGGRPSAGIHTPDLGCPAPQTRHPPRQALLSFVHPSLLVPVGWGYLSSGTGETDPGEELARAREAAPRPGHRRSLPASRWPPAPARCSPSRRCRSQRRAALRALGERGGVAEGRSGICALTSAPASRIHIHTLTPRPHPRPPPGRAFAADGAGRPGGSCGGRERRGERGEPPRTAWPRAEPGGAAGERGGGCSPGRGLSRGWDDKTGGNCI